MKFTDQDFLDIVDAMPADQKGCSVVTNEDGTGTVDLRHFIVNFGRALETAFSKPQRKPRKGKTHDDTPAA